MAFGKNDVCRVSRGYVLGALVAEFESVDICQKVLSGSKQYRGNGKVHLIDEPGAKILSDGRDSAAEPDVFSVGRIGGSLQRHVDTIGYKMKGRAASHDDRFARMVGEHENRRVVRRVIAPPSLPGVIGPWPSDRPEHIAAQDPGTDIVKSPRGEIVIRPARAAIGAMHLAKRLGWEKPLVQGDPAYTQRMFEVLFGTRAIAVDGYRKTVHAQLGHLFQPFF